MSTAAARDAESDRPGKRTLLLRFLVVALLVVADQWSKSAVFDWLEGGILTVEGMEIDRHGHDRFPVAGGEEGPLANGFLDLGFMLVLNPGAAFGKFGDFPHVLVGGRLIAAALLSWLLLRARKGEGLGLVALVLVLSGALGNLIDNLWTGPTKEGHPYGLVRDFIDAWFLRWDFHFHTFNVADACISVGAVAWILSGLLHRAPAEEGGESVPAQDAERPGDSPAT